MGHTPGPWEADSTAVLTSHPPYLTVADCSHRGHTLATEEANARLIAAAPDMLEVLEEMLAEHPGCCYAGEKASAAIANARGG